MLNIKIKIGIFVLIAGLFLVFAFWPLVSVTGEDLRLDREILHYRSYNEGDKVLIHERIVRLDGIVWFGLNMTQVEIEDGSATEQTFFYVQGDATKDFKAGDMIYTTLTLKQLFGLEYWQVDNVGDIHQSWPVDVIFYLVTLLGAILLFLGLFEMRRGY